MKYVSFLFFSLLLVVGWAFGVQNAAVLSYPVSLKLQFWTLIGFETRPMPLGASLVSAFIAGLLFTLVGLLSREIRLRRELRTKSLENRHLHTELSNLRQQVLQSDEEHRATPTMEPRTTVVASS